jgi:integrase
MRPPTFPLNRTETYSVVRGVVLFHHHGSWCIRYRRHGKKVEESLSTQDDRLAWAELQKASKAIVDGETPQALVGARHYESMTVADAAKAFLAEYTEISLGTQRKLRGVMSQWLIGERLAAASGQWVKRLDADLSRPFGRLEVHAVEKRDVKNHLRQVRATVNRLGRRNRRATAKIVLDAIRLLFNWLIDEGILKGKDGRVLANAAARCGKFTFDAEQDTKRDAETKGDELVKIFEPDQEQALIAWYFTHCRRLYPFLLLGFHSGLRYGEVVALEVDDYQPERHRVSVKKHWTPEGVILGTKSNRMARGILKTREVSTDLHPALEPALDAHIRSLKENQPRGWDGKRLFPAKAYTGPDGSTNVGAYITPNNFYRAVWKKACHELGIKGLAFHAARHTFASKCLHAGATPQEVAAWLGDTLEVFYRYYAHVIEGLRKDRAGLLSQQATPAGRRRQLRVVKGARP